MLKKKLTKTSNISIVFFTITSLLDMENLLIRAARTGPYRGSNCSILDFRAANGETTCRLGSAHLKGSLAGQGIIGAVTEYPLLCSEGNLYFLTATIRW